MAGHMDEVDLEVTYLPIHELNPENELTEISYLPTPSYREESSPIHRETEESVEYKYETVRESHRSETTVTNAVVSEERMTPTPMQRVHIESPPPTTTSYQPPVQHETSSPPTVAGPKKAKRVTIAFPSFGRKTSASRHQDEVGHDTNGESHREPMGPDSPVTITIYPRRLIKPMNILRIIQIVLGVIVCGSINAEQCFGAACVSASSIMWSGQLGGIGYVLFVGVVFILGNFAWLFYHIYTKPASPLHTSRVITENRVKMAELIYNGLAVLMYLIAACVAAWYASFTIWPSGSNNNNPYRPQWICATIFAWINTGVYIFGLAYSILA